MIKTIGFFALLFLCNTAIYANPYFFKHVIENDIEYVKNALSQDSRLVHSRDEYKNTPLHYAARGHIEIMHLLLDNGAHINVLNDFGQTPLRSAIGYKSLESLTFLLENGADPNIGDNFSSGRTPLEEICHSWPTAKSDATLSLEREMASQLIDAGASMRRAITNISTYGEVCQDTISPFFIAIANKNIHLIDLMLKKGFGLYEKGKPDMHSTERTPLDAAYYRAALGLEPQKDVIDFLMSKDVNVNKSFDYNTSTFFKAAQEGNIELLQTLITMEIDPNLRTTDGGSTALIFAASKNLSETVEMLINRYNIDLNIQNDNGNSALMVAIESKAFDVIPILIDKGVDINAQNKEGESALSMIVRLIQPSITLESIIGGKNARNNKVDESILKMTSFLILNGADVNAINLKDESVLMIASKGKIIEIVSLLIEHGANVNFENKIRDTALFYAIQAGSTDIAKLLINNGADLNTINYDDETPYEMAQSWSRPDIASFIENYAK
ncbi:hypothetical protein EH223_07645 [candidate division KSB1 bacterium]|nr:ankyrin repeat domain-containing protein [candidate division KSB1 bacterium]RQW04415.1 MAG: hypothetical protein EH223_07645 [candidate division KSB1 bacterium]